MNVAFGMAFALMFSGALAGLTGVIEVSALHTRLKDGISGGFGFSGILVALLGRLHPVGVLFAALFFAALTIGAQSIWLNPALNAAGLQSSNGELLTIGSF